MYRCETGSDQRVTKAAQVYERKAIIDLSNKTPVELRTMARELGIEGWDRMTKSIALAAILKRKEELGMTQSQFTVFEGEDGLWYWRHVADNGEPLSRSSEGYVTKWNAERARDRAIELAAEEWARQDAAKRLVGDELHE